MKMDTGVVGEISVVASDMGAGFFEASLPPPDDVGVGLKPGVVLNELRKRIRHAREGKGSSSALAILYCETAGRRRNCSNNGCLSGVRSTGLP